jgi:polysaccharide biosynthesis transport protein
LTDVPAARPHGVPIGPWEERLPALYEASEQRPIEPHESVIRHYWRIIYRHRWIVLAAVVACVGIALLASMLMQREYTAMTRIEIAREAANITNIEGVESEESRLADLEFYQTQYALLKSRSLSESVVRSLSLESDYDFLSDYDESEAASLKELSRERRFMLATEKVNEQTIVSPVRGSSIVDVGYRAPDPEVAARIANEIAEKFIETNLSRRFEATAYARQFLQNRLAAVRTRLEQSERQATAYARGQGLISVATGDGSRDQLLINAELAQLTSQLADARAAREKAEGDYRGNAGGNAAERSLSNIAVNQLRQQRGILSAELQKLESDFGPEYPRVQALRQQLAELNRQIAREESVVRSGVNRDIYDRYRQALATEQGLQRRVDQLKAAVLDQQQRAIQLNIIQRDVDTNRALYDALLQRFKEVGVAGGIGTNNVSVVDPALPPENPSSPNLPLNLALGLLLGFLLGVGAAFVLEQLSESVILPAEFQRKLGIPLLGSTPAVKGEVRSKLLGFSRATDNHQAPLLRSSDSDGSTTKSALLNTSSELAESYYSILTALQFSTTEGTPQTISVTSSQAGEGKSTTAVALARSLAGIGARVLLIDADLRAPSLHRWFGMRAGPGLSEFLTRHAALMELVHKSDSPGLSVLLAGTIPPNPSELLATGALERALKVALENFEHVIIDAPPVLGLSDAPQIARATEGTVFVVEAGRTRASHARHAIDRLLQVRAHIIGAVLTKLDSRSSGYGYGYSYNYKYGGA